MENENKYRLPEEQKFEVFGQMMTEAEYDAWVENNIASSQPKVSNQLLEACLFSDLEGIKMGLKRFLTGLYLRMLTYIVYRLRYTI